MNIVEIKTIILLSPLLYKIIYKKLDKSQIKNEIFLKFILKSNWLGLLLDFRLKSLDLHIFFQ